VAAAETDVAEDKDKREGFRIPNLPRKDLAACGLVACCEVPATGSLTPWYEHPPPKDKGDFPDIIKGIDSVTCKSNIYASKAD